MMAVPRAALQRSSAGVLATASFRLVSPQQTRHSQQLRLPPKWVQSQ